MDRPSGQTSRLAATLVWEFWARGWPGILAGPAAALLLPGLIFVSWMSLDSDEAFRYAAFVLRHLAMFYATVLALGSVMLLSRGKPRFEFTLPAPSLLLVAAPMICGMVTMFFQYAIVAMILNAAFHIGWPIVGPGLLAAALIAWSLAVLWATSESFGLRCLACLGSIVALAFANAPSESTYDQTMVNFLPHVTDRHLVAFGLATLVSIGVGTAGFGALRHGVRIDFWRIIDRLTGGIRISRTASAKPFSSPSVAQFWLEWMQRGYVLAILATFLGIGMLVLAWANSQHVSQYGVVHFVSAAERFPLLPLFVIGIFWGCRSSDFAFGNFSGSRPLSDGQVASAVLKSATFALIVSGLIWAAFIALAALIVAFRQGTFGPFDVLSQIDPAMFLAEKAYVALMMWSIVGVTTSVAMAGKRAMRIAFLLLVGAFVGGILLNRLVPYNSIFTREYSTCCFVLYILACGAAFAVAWRWRLISNRTLWMAAAIALTTAGTMYLAHPTGHLPTMWDRLLAVGVCGAIPVPLAAAPLAVYFNRHR